MSTLLQAARNKLRLEEAILVPLIFIPRLLDLDVFLTADEPLFLEQAREFAAGLIGGEFNRTLGIGYPGITLAWWSAPVVGLAPSTEPATALAAYTAGRVATALVTGLLLLMLYVLARRLAGRGAAWLGVGMLALDPYTLAYSRLLHIAAPLALFMNLAGLAGLLWLRDGRPRHLGLAGLFSGLALLTKSTALLLGPMLGLALLGWVVAAGQSAGWGWWRAKIGGLAVIALTAVVVFFALWPAMWVEPARALGLTLGKLLTDQEAGSGNLGFFWWGHYVEDPGPAFYPVAFLLKATPWLLIGLGLSLGLAAACYGLRLPFISGSRPLKIGDVQHAAGDRRTPLATDHHFLSITLALWLFALTYLVLMTIASKKSIRYMLPAFPAFYLLAGLAFDQVVKAIKNKDFFRAKRYSPAEALTPFSRKNGRIPFASSPPHFAASAPLHLLIFLPLLLFALFYHPYYFTYYNPLLLGWRWAPQTLLVGWGEGLDEAARYLNEQPPGTVAAWYDWLFPIFYRGHVVPVTPQENLITADYDVLYLNQVQRNIPGPNVIHYFQTRRRPKYTVRLAGIDYAWVYAGPIARFSAGPAPQYPLGGEFGGEVRLLGYDLQPQARSGQPLIVTLYWRALVAPPAGRFVYVRLVDAEGHIWARADGPPVMGLWPADRWQPEMLVEDAQELPIPAGTPPGAYRLEVGWYDPATGQPLPAVGRPVGQGGGLLLGEVQVAWQPRSTEADLPHRTDTRLAPNARLIGYDNLPAAVATGDLVPIRLAWREARSIFAWGAVPNNSILFEWRPASGQTGGPPLAEQLDELPLPIEKWGHRATLLSQHDLIVPPTLATGRYELAVRLHTGSDPAGDAFSLGFVEVTSPPHDFELPATARSPVGAAKLADTITLAGYDYQIATGESPPGSFELQLYWRTETPLTARYKVFVQLLAGDNTLVAQSDNFPAAGQRPTSGWLPGEIIADPHTLSLAPNLPAGVYQLIAGLYNPASGERLPILNQNGETVADAIFITEVTLP